MTSRDVGLVPIAGHGQTDDKLNYWFLPADATLAKLRATGVSQDDILRAMRGLAGKSLLFLDTCHANRAVAADTGNRSPVDMSCIVDELAKTENGVAVFSSSQGREISEKSADWGQGHGAFTEALLEGLGEGKADIGHKGTIRCVDARRLYRRTGQAIDPRPSTSGDEPAAHGGRFHFGPGALKQPRARCATAARRPAARSCRRPTEPLDSSMLETDPWIVR